MARHQFFFNVALPLGIIADGIAWAEDGRLDCFQIDGRGHEIEAPSGTPRSADEVMAAMIARAIEHEHRLDLADSRRRESWAGYAPIYI